MRPTAAPRVAGRLWGLLAGHVVPAAVFALLLLNQAARARDAIAAATSPGAPPAGMLRAANSVLVVEFATILRLIAALMMLASPASR